MNIRRIRVHAHGSSNRLNLSQGKFQSTNATDLEKTNRIVNKNDFETSCNVSSSCFRIKMNKSCNGSFNVNTQPKGALPLNLSFKTSVQMTHRAQQQNLNGGLNNQQKKIKQTEKVQNKQTEVLARN